MTGSTRSWLIAASTGFLLLAGLAVRRSTFCYTLLIFAALLFCWFGDYLGPLDFRVGLLSFLVAHIVFLIAFCRQCLAANHSWWSAAVTLPLGMGLGVWLLPYVPQAERMFVIAYMVVITAMVIAAFGGCWRHRRLVPLVASVFYVSEIVVARWRFVSPGVENAFICYPLYYAACLLFAWSAFLQPMPLKKDVAGKKTGDI